MKLAFATFAFVTALATASPSFAQSPVGAPAGSDATPAKTTTAETAPATPTTSTVSSKKVVANSAAPTPPASGEKYGGLGTSAWTYSEIVTKTGGGKVWVDRSSKVYYCSGTKHPGSRKKGDYMSEAAAKAAGNLPDHGKACS